MRALPLCLLLLACRTKAPLDEAGDLDTGGLAAQDVDADADGYLDDEDCDEADPAIHPDAAEICDGVDNNCDGQVDEGVTDVWYTDADGDGYGDPDAPVEGCAAPADAVANGSDCDDSASDVWPGAIEACDGIDNDCDGDIDEDGATLFYTDADGDGHGDPTTGELSCAAEAGQVSSDDDCDDDDDNAFPGNPEICDGVDNNCDGAVDEGVTSLFYADADGDGHGDAGISDEACDTPEGYVDNASDCDDTNDAVSPDADELCNSVDDDCDGTIDEADATDASDWYLDADTDGFGDPASTTAACDAPSGYLADNTDCDDSSSAVNPDATEVCNSIDDDCDGDIDDDDTSLDDSTGSAWYADSDSDGYGDPSASTQACAQPSGYLADATDCDDSDSSISPAGSEVCNSVDDDCDGDIDDDDSSVDASTGSTWYTDTDGDSYGDPATGAWSCSAPASGVSNDDDCDDGNAAVNPGETEVCNSIDDDCDGDIDDDDTSLDDTTGGTWYRDSDSDGYGDASSSAAACSAPSDYLANDDDCDDSDAAINPGEAEICNSVDDDCDGDIDDADSDVDTSAGDVYYADADLDGYGDASSATTACAEPSGYTDDDTDCDDTDADINPDGTEVCNGYDDDCDDVADDAGDCPCDVEYASGDTTHPYMFCTTAAAWTTGQAACDAVGYHLAALDDATEASWADTTADTYSTGKWWFGLNDRASEGTWMNDNGTAAAYTNWHSGEPNNSGGGEDCVQLNRWTDQSWNDEPCGSSFRYICEAW